MNTFTIGDALGYGWRGFWKNFAPLVLIALAVFVVQGGLNLLGYGLDSPFLKWLVSLVSSVISIMIALGWIRVGLGITRGEKIEVGEMFRFEGWLRYLVASVLFGIGFFIGLVFFVIPGIIFALFFGFFGWVIVDRDAGISDSFSRSAEITKGNRWNLFGFGIVLLLVNLLGLMLFVIGVLFTMGISLVAVAYVYRVMSGDTPITLS